LADKIDTPAFVTDEKTLQSDLELLRKIADQASCKLLYSPKACSLSTVLRSVNRQVDGFACSRRLSSVWSISSVVAPVRCTW